MRAKIIKRRSHLSEEKKAGIASVIAAGILIAVVIMVGLVFPPR